MNFNNRAILSHQYYYTFVFLCIRRVESNLHLSLTENKNPFNSFEYVSIDVEGMEDSLCCPVNLFTDN